MSLTTDGFICERPHPVAAGGVQRLYRWGWWGLSVVNGDLLHSFPYAWEVAVLKFENEGPDANFSLTYETPLTDDVEVFQSDEETNAFIARAREWFKREMLDRMTP